MPNAALLELEPRKTPQQSRSVATVEAIHDATIQVLLKDEADRLTTVRVAQRAGVSVGTLYQYFPNKQALMFAVLERHLLQVAKAVEDACATNHFQPLEVMVDELVNRFIDAKLADRDTSVALYRIAAGVGGSRIVDRIRRRSQAAMTAMLQTANLPVSADVNFMVHMLHLTMAGTLRWHLESNAPLRMTRKLREHLSKLVLAYCKAM
ncbi:MAG: TetR/AcrR family transcriptional regulator [Terracidiphilus sp.]|nr:TetR/AcrR family transcriptional regulator [Terracidiphilus sp.]MDR3776919.1 TetR/AcrR family transcriptional regulator [Terracidiphilus sp.]